MQTPHRIGNRFPSWLSVHPVCLLLGGVLVCVCLRSFCFPFSIPPSNRRRRVSIRYGAAKHVGPPEEKFMLLRKSICRRCNFEPFLRSCPGSGFGEGFLFLVAGTVWGSLSHGPGFAGFAHRNLLSIAPFPKEWLFCFCFASPCTTQKCIVLSCRQSMYANEGKKRLIYCRAG